MGANKKESISYLSNFKKEEMEILFKDYEHYAKLNTSAKTPALFALAMAGISRLLMGSMPRNQVIVLTVIVMSVLMIWLFIIAYKIIKQKKLINLLLKTMASAQNYPYKTVKKEFNTLIRTVHKGPKI
ncbi:MAG: hypothetical protein GYB37_02085 [Algicola sp.]|nr:hypothetical protein [Algicola sp.]